MLKQRVPRTGRDLAIEAAGALARLDADRLEEIAEICVALSQSRDTAKLGQLEAADRHEMRVFSRILEATRTNLNVLSRLRESQSPTVEYDFETGGNVTFTEMRHGNN
jgi:hypothetical protein